MEVAEWDGRRVGDVIPRRVHCDGEAPIERGGDVDEMTGCGSGRVHLGG